MQSAIADRLGQESFHDPSTNYEIDAFASLSEPLVTNATCELVGSMWSNIIQIMLGICSGLPLIYKWYTETPRRSLITFSIDTSKQVLGSLTTHFLNLILAEGLSSALVSDINLRCRDDRCVFYFVTFVGDATLCLLFCFLLLKGLKWLAAAFHLSPLERYGYYGDSTTGKRLVKSRLFWQLISWIFIIIISKFIYLVLTWPYQSLLRDFGRDILSPVRCNNVGPLSLELLTVMLFVPTVFNAISFWVTDTFIRHYKPQSCSGSPKIPHAGSENSDEEGRAVKNMYETTP